MPAYLVHVGATLTCGHATGQGQPAPPSSSVRVSGQLVVPAPTAYTVTGCANPPPSASNGPCATADWMTFASRVKVRGQPVLLADSTATCKPTMVPLNVVATQVRVKGT